MPLDEEAGEEDHEAELRNLARLKVHRADTDPDTRSVDGLADGCERQREQAHPEEERDVPVAVELPGAAHDGERCRVGTDAHSGPESLLVGERRGEADDEGVPDAVEERGEREQHRLGMASKDPVGDMHAENQCTYDPDERLEIAGHAFCAPKADEHIQADRHRDDEEDEAEFGTPPVEGGEATGGQAQAGSGPAAQPAPGLGPDAHGLPEMNDPEVCSKPGVAPSASSLTKLSLGGALGRRGCLRGAPGGGAARGRTTRV